MNTISKAATWELTHRLLWNEERAGYPDRDALPNRLDHPLFHFFFLGFFAGFFFAGFFFPCP